MSCVRFETVGTNYSVSRKGETTESSAWNPMLLDSVQAIRFVAERLDSLADRVVFLGGAGQPDVS
jgi:hypothetical protein